MSQPCAEKPWSVASFDSNVVDVLARGTGLSRTASKILASRGLQTVEEAQRFLSPALDRDWLEPEVIPGMGAVADRVAAAVRAGERIVVFGDFDLDGISAAAVATRGLRAMGADVSAVVPHRFREGYGLSAAAIERVMTLRPALVVTVDCGISGRDEVEILLGHGVDVAVTDHHEPGGSVPMGVPVADPKLTDDCPSRDLAGAGVALKLVQSVGERVGFPAVWRELTDLAMLGTVADIVPLRGENRALVADGVSRCRLTPRVPIAALAAVAGVSLDSFTSDNIAFALAPRLNAPGRMADPAIALDLLLTDDPLEAERLSLALDEQNRIRQATEADLSDAASALAERTYRGERALVLAGDGWHEGVKGIVASRMTGRYRVPSLLFTIEDGVARGSGRSVGSVNLYQAVEHCADLLERFGGHEAAVGLTLPADSLPSFRERLIAYLDTLPAEQFESALAADTTLKLDEISAELGEELAALEPFGHTNPRPLLIAEGVFMNGRAKVGKTGTHLKFIAYDGVASVPAIAFRCRDIDVHAGHDAAVDLAFEIDVDRWRGKRRVQLIVRDFHVRAVSDDAPAADLVSDLFERADEIIAREEYSGIGDAPSFNTKLAGVTFEGRQDALARLESGSLLRLERQPDNEYDTNACALFDTHGAQVGFLNRRLAAVLAPVLDSGVEYDVEVTEVTGGDNGRSLGVNVLLGRRDVAETGAAEEEARTERRAQLSSLPASDLDAELVRAFIGDRSLHEAQARSLAELAAGRNTLTVMATGRGKSLIFHLHAARTALREGAASVFVYPLRALVADQAFHLEEAFRGVGLSVRTVTGETGPAERDTAFADLTSGDLDVVLTTPEFLHFHCGRFTATGRIGFVVVDEAHHVGLARAGHRPAYARLGDAVAQIGSPTVLAVTATASDDVANLIRSSLSIESTVLDPTVRENLLVEDQRGHADKDAYLCALAARGEKAVIYVNSRDKSVQIARLLRKRVPESAMRTAFYNGGLSRSVRHAVESAFRDGDLRFVVATSAFGEGVNIPDIRHVVLYHLPFNEVEFNQMAGRAGRDGAASRIHLLFGEKDARINEMILSTLAPERSEMVALYRVLRDLQQREGDGFEVTNAELAERARKLERSCKLDDRGVSSALGVFRDLGLVTGEGHGAYRRLTVMPTQGKVELGDSVRYEEGLDEIEQFEAFKERVFTATAEDLLGRFNRPILPSQ